MYRTFVLPDLIKGQSLIAHLLKWEFRPSHRGASWEKTIKAQSKDILYALKESPSLKARLDEPGLDCFPDEPL